MSLITYITRIHFADRVVEDALGEEVAKLGLRRPVVFCDSAATGDALDRVLDALPRGMAATGPRRAPDRIGAAVLAQEATLWAEAGCDAAIGVGGPAALDLARAVGRAGPVRAGMPCAPVVTIPTTTAGVGLGPLPPALGSGEARPPTLILCDPTMTLAAGGVETAAAGMNALVHCLEALLAAAWNPPADGIALDGLRRAGRWLRRAVEDGSDVAARRELLAAALDAGLAAEKGLGGVRALAHALEEEAWPGAAADVESVAGPHPPSGNSKAGANGAGQGTGRVPGPRKDRGGDPALRHVIGHGSLHAALVRPVLAFNAPAVADRLDAAREALRLPPGAELGTALAELGAGLGLPDRLGGLGLERTALRRAARRAAEDPATLTNPRHATEADYLAMLEAAL